MMFDNIAVWIYFYASFSLTAFIQFITVKRCIVHICSLYCGTVRFSGIVGNGANNDVS